MQPLDTIIAEAAARFAIPERWIRAVMQAESAGDARAVSSAGAMGLMQIMPATWRELRTRHGLGTDPFDPRDNIFAGAAYLRAMYDRFGLPGFLAAYNAGPERYAEYLATGRSLPQETLAYLATLTPLIGGLTAEPVQSDGTVLVVDWRDAPLFVVHPNRAPRAASIDYGPSSVQQPTAPSGAELLRDRPPSDGLFVQSQAQGSE